MASKLIDANQYNAGQKYRLLYCTTSKYKRQEIEEISRTCSVSIPDGKSQFDVSIGKLFTIKFKDIDLTEILERDIRNMVFHKAVRAYEAVQVPCIVEHAGLIFQDYLNESYPGGLTQPIWDALGARKFIEETRAKEREVTARAVVGYCDGKHVKTFVGDTTGRISAKPRGRREFYWDTIFVPTHENKAADGLTYAEMAAKKSLGIAFKVTISQSAKAMKKCLQYIASNGDSGLFSSV